MFVDIREKMQAHFNQMLKSQLYYINIDRDKIWETYLNAFQEENRQSNNCNCCKAFLRQLGGIVNIKNNKIVSIWDFNPEDEEYNDSIKALSSYVHSLPITDVFLNDNAFSGTNKNFDSKMNAYWNHFYLKIPRIYISTRADSVKAEKRDNFNLLLRGLTEISQETIETVLELINANSIYRGTQNKTIVAKFLALKKEFKKIKNNDKKRNFCWAKSLEKNSVTLCRIRNSSIGTLLIDIEEGKSLDQAVASYEQKVAPENYQRTSAVVTPRMVKEAQKKIKDLGYMHSLNRRLLEESDLNVNNSLYVCRSFGKDLDIFDEIIQEAPIKTKDFSKLDEVSIDDFINNIVPTSNSIKVLFENKHLNNLVSLVGPNEQADLSMFKWENNYSWSYTGEVTDSIKERVKRAGGKVNGYLRISLSWSNYDDLDLHVLEPNNGHISFSQKTGKSHGKLDVDMNAGGRHSRTPVENIIWVNKPKLNGKYQVYVHNYTKRENKDEGFEIELELNGEIYTFEYNSNGRTKQRTDVLTFEVSKDGVKLNNCENNSVLRSKTKWGINTAQFHTVKALTLSPNHWDGNYGNKHFFFMLENCVPDDEDNIRPFYNEFLNKDLIKHKKVFEVLASKAKVSKVDAPLAGLGFSDTQKGSIIVEVEGKIKRKLKVNIK